MNTLHHDVTGHPFDLGFTVAVYAVIAGVVLVLAVTAGVAVSVHLVYSFLSRIPTSGSWRVYLN